MKKSTQMALTVFALFGILSLQPASMWANEHGGMTMQEHGGSTMKDDSDAATLNEAAALLKSSNPELAKKLENMAAKQCKV